MYTEIVQEVVIRTLETLASEEGVCTWLVPLECAVTLDSVECCTLGV